MAFGQKYVGLVSRQVTTHSMLSLLTSSVYVRGFLIGGEFWRDAGMFTSHGWIMGGNCWNRWSQLGRDVV